MKNLILILFISLQASSFLSSQEVVTIKPEKLYTYCELGGSWNTLGTKMEVWINYGEPASRNTKPVIFNSMIDAMNSMAKQGWELVTAYSIPVASHHVHYYILRKEVTQSRN